MAVKSTHADQERLTTMAEATKKFDKKAYRAELDKRFKQEVKDVMESLGVSRKKAAEIVIKKDFKNFNKRMGNIEKSIDKLIMEESKITEINKGGLLKKKKAKKMMGGGKVYARGSRKANYSG